VETFGDRDVEIVAVGISGERSASHNVASGENIAIKISVLARLDVSDLTVGIEITDDHGEIAFGTNTHHLRARRDLAAGTRCDVVFNLRANLNLGHYHVTLALHTGADHRAHCFHWVDRASDFTVTSYNGAAFVGYAALQPAVAWGGPICATVDSETGHGHPSLKSGIAVDVKDEQKTTNPRSIDPINK
jgi:lipopolysaccharide transport system ATP-binding protein